MAKAKKFTRTREAVTVDVEKFRAALEGTGFPATTISEMIGKQKAYICSVYKDGRIGRENLDKICRYFNLNAEDFIFVPEPPAVENPEPKLTAEEKAPVAPTVDMSEVTKRLDTLISAVEFLSKGLDTLTAATMQTQKRLAAIEQSCDKTAKYTAATVEELKVDLDSIDDGIGKVNSNLVVLKGRLDDLSNTPSIRAVK